MGAINLDIAVTLLSKIGPGLTNLKAELKQALSKLDLKVQDSKKIMAAFGIDPKNTAKSLQEIVTLFKTAKRDIIAETKKLPKEDFLNLGMNKTTFKKALTLLFDEAFNGLSAGMLGRFDKAFSKLGNLQQPAAIKRLIESIKTDLELAVKSGLINTETKSRYDTKLSSESARLAGIQDAKAYQLAWTQAIREDKRLNKMSSDERAAYREKAKLEAKAYKDAWTQAIREDKRINKMSSDERAAYREKGKREAKAYTDAWAEALNVNKDRSAAEKKAAQQTIQLSKEVADKTKAYATESTRASQQALASGVRSTAQAADKAAAKVKATYAEIKALQSKQGVAFKLGNFQEVDILAAKITKLSSQAKRELGQVWQHAGTQVPAFTKKFEDAMTAMSYRFTHVGAQFTIFSSMALNAFRAPLTAALELDRELGFIQSIAKSGSLSFDDLRNSILKMGTNSIYSVQKIAEGVRTLAQAGFDSAQAMQAVPAVLDFAAAGMVGLDEAAKIAFNTMTIFSGPQGMQELPRLLSEFASAANKSNTDVKGLGTAMKSAAPIARQLGYTASETLAILGQLSKGGLGESLAGTSLRNMLQRLLTTAGPADKALKKLGLTLKDFQDPQTKEFAKMPEIIDKFNAALNNLDPVEKAEAIASIFRTRGAAGFLVLLQQGSEGLRQMQKEIEISGNNALIAAERAETLWGSFERMKNAVTALSATLGEALASSLGPFAEGLRIIASSLVTALQGSAALRGLVSVGALLTGLVAVVAAGAGAFTLLSSAVTSAMGAFPGLLRLLGRTRLAKVEHIAITKQMTTAERIAAVTTNEAAAAQARLNIAAGKSANGVMTLGQSFKSAGFMMKSVAVLSILPDLLAIGTAIKELTGIFSDNADQAARARAEQEKYSKIIGDKPLLNADEFELLSEKEKSEEIKRLAAIEAKAYSVIADIERRQASPLGIFNKEALKKEMEQAKKDLADAIAHEKFYVSDGAAKLRLYDEASIAEDQEGATDTLDFFQKAIFDHNKKTASGTIFDLSVVIGDIDKANESYLMMADSISKVGLSSQETAKHSSQLHNVTLKGMSTSIQAAGEYVGQLLKVASLEENSATRAIKATKLATTYKLAAIKEWKESTEIAIRDYAIKTKASEADINASKKQMYTTAQGELKKLIDNSLKMYEKHSKEVIEIEANTQRERLAEKQHAEELLSASDKLKSGAQLAAEEQRKLVELWDQYNKQVAAGARESALATIKEIDKLNIKAATGLKDHYADSWLEIDKIAEEIAQKEAQRSEKLRERGNKGTKAAAIASIEEEIRLLKERNKEEFLGLEAQKRKVDEKIKYLQDKQNYQISWTVDEKSAKKIEDQLQQLQEKSSELEFKIESDYTGGDAKRKLEEEIRLLKERKKEAQNSDAEGDADLADLDKEIALLKEKKRKLDESLDSQNAYAASAREAYEERKKFDSLEPWEKKAALDEQALNTQKSITRVMEEQENLRQAGLTESKTAQDAYLSFLKEVEDYYTKLNNLSKGLLGYNPASLPTPPKMARGGPIFGSGNGDTVPILAQPGEFMLSRKMVNLFGGLNVLEAIRSKVMGGIRTAVSFGMPALATGGAIGGGAPMGSYALDLNLTTGAGSTKARLYGEKDIIESVINVLRRESLTQR